MHFLGSVAGVIDPIYAGALVKSGIGGWRWIFYIDSIFYGIGAVLVFFVYQTTSRVEALGVSKRQVARQFDYMGIVLLAAGIILLIAGLSWGGSPIYGWTSAYALGPTIVGGICLVLLLPLWEIYGTKTPFLVLSLFKDRTYVMLLILAFVNGSANLCSTVCKLSLPHICLTEESIG